MDCPYANGRRGIGSGPGVAIWYGAASRTLKSGHMMLRWMAAGVLEAAKGFRRLKGYADMPTLVNALRARDRQLGLVSGDADRQVA